MINKLEANTLLNNIIDIQDQRLDKYYSWLRNIVTISVGLFGILIAFKTNDNEHFYKSILFVISIFSLGLGIIFSLIALFTEIHLLDKQKSYLMKSFIDMIDGKNFSETDFENIKPTWFYRISAKLNIFFFLISVFTLIAYSSFDLFYHIFK